MLSLMIQQGYEKDSESSPLKALIKEIYFLIQNIVIFILSKVNMNSTSNQTI